MYYFGFNVLLFHKTSIYVPTECLPLSYFERRKVQKTMILWHEIVFTKKDKQLTHLQKLKLIIHRGVSGFLKVGGQVVIQVVMRRGAAASGAFYSAKKWGGNCPLCPPFTYAPVN